MGKARMVNVSFPLTPLVLASRADETVAVGKTVWLLQTRRGVVKPRIVALMEKVRRVRM